jgi:hypothetical protein
MRRSPKPCAWPILFLSFLFLAFAAVPPPAAAEPDQKAAVTTEDGVRVVRNPRTPVAGPGGASAVVTLVEDLVIGDDTEGDDNYFIFLNSLAVDDHGNIYTVDPKAIRIRVFGPDGTLLRAFGRAGQGPGEFSGPGGIVAARDGTILVSDVLKRRVSHFNAKGEHLKDTSHGALRLAGLRIDARGDFYASRFVPGEKSVWELVKLDRDLKPHLTIHTLSVNLKPRINEIFSHRFFYDVAGGDRLAWIVSDSYEVRVVDASGRTLMKIVKDHAPRRLTAKDREEHLRRRFPKGFKPLPGEELVFPEVFPAVSAFMADETGRIYVRTYDTDGRGGEAVDVFDPEGLYVARFFVPWNEETVAVRGGKLYCLIKESAAGNPLVKRYALNWK